MAMRKPFDFVRFRLPFVYVRFRLRRALEGTVVFGLIALLAVVGIAMVQRNARYAGAPPQRPAPVILLDAGHGGEDGGAVGVGGLVEKDLNLAITCKLDSFLRAMGYETALTRDCDTDLHDASAVGVRERKTSDILKRFAMMEALGGGDLFVSIHQNKFGAQSAHGTQVFYSSNTPQSAVLAESIQERVVGLLQPGNHRLIKPAGDSIYLLYNAKKTAVLVECGFISNVEEAEKLRQDEYQNQMAFAIACGILDYGG